MRTITDDQRRARLAHRQGLLKRVGTVEEAVESVVCLHATEAPTVYLSVVARADATIEDVSRALYEDRTVIKQLAMRRTMFTFPREVLPAVWGSASRRVAEQLQARLAREVEAHGIAKRGDVWLTRMSATVRAALAEAPATTAELRERIPSLARRLDMSPGKSYGANVPIAPRVLSTIAATGKILRGSNEGDWRTSRPRWALTEDWLGTAVVLEDPAVGYRDLVRRWLRRFGPGTESDLVWWLGATKGAVRRALADLDAVEVSLSGGTVGFLLPDDLDDEPEPEPWAALLPVLDPTTMGWKEREFYLDPVDRPFLFDTNGNAGSTAWWCGRVVGCWVQDPDGVVQVVLRGDPGSEALTALQAEAERLTAWLDGAKVSTVYTSPQMRSALPT